MNPGELNKRIIIQQLADPPTVTNDNGFEIENWEDYKTVWASVSNLYGREYFAAKAVQAESTVKFIIRYISGLTNQMRISFNDKIYNIDFIDNIKYGNAYMEIKAIEVQNG